MNNRLFLNAPLIIAEVLGSVVRPGDLVVDCTAGNGHDTLHLARLVGNQGQVYSLDVQQQALDQTATLLRDHGWEHPVLLRRMGHENIRDLGIEGVRAFVFNLGYLPGGDKTKTTRAETTVQAVQACLDLLGPGGVVCLTIYPGHREGHKEQQHLTEYVEGLDQNHFDVVQMQFPNRKNNSPYPLILQKIGKDDHLEEEPPPGYTGPDYDAEY